MDMDINDACGVGVGGLTKVGDVVICLKMVDMAYTEAIIATASLDNDFMYVAKAKDRLPRLVKIEINSR